MPLKSNTVKKPATKKPLFGLGAQPNRTCSKCKKSLPIDSFSINRHKLSGYNSACRECKKPFSRLYYYRNREARIEKGKEYYKRNSDWIGSYAKEYREAHMPAYREYWKRSNKRRRELKRKRRVGTINWYLVYQRCRGICGICGDFVPRSQLTLDHIVPLSRGGWHCNENLQIAHFICNSSKGNSFGDKPQRRRRRKVDLTKLPPRKRYGDFQID
jgi:5-methylcytosine-specific restriction endonuclease McrA